VGNGKPYPHNIKKQCMNHLIYCHVKGFSFNRSKTETISTSKSALYPHQTSRLCWSAAFVLKGLWRIQLGEFWFESQNWGRVQQSWQPNCCFSTIPNHMILDPMYDFGWLRLGSMSCISLAAVWFGCWSLWKIQLGKFWFESQNWGRIQPLHDSQTIASQPSSQFTWYTPWMILDGLD
jgi:hypothetical protein